ncbi:restriction endonuclease subunit S, partial [Neglecta sp. X4]
EALKSYKRGLLKHIFDDHYGSGWHEVSLGEISQITMGQSPDSASYNIDQIGLPLVQGNADITDGITTPQRYTSAPTKICDAGSIILSVRAPVGSVSWANQRLCLGRGVCAITAQNTKFLYQLLIHHQDDWKRIEQGGTFTAISGDDISSFKVSVPNKDTQSTISFFLSKYDAMEQREENVLRVLQRQKAALLQQLFI